MLPYNFVKQMPGLPVWLQSYKYLTPALSRAGIEVRGAYLLSAYAACNVADIAPLHPRPLV